MKPGEWRQELGSPGLSPGVGGQIEDLKRSQMEQEEEGSQEGRAARDWTVVKRRKESGVQNRRDAREQKKARVR